MSPKDRSNSLPNMTAKNTLPLRRLSLDLERDPSRRPVAHGGFSDVYRVYNRVHGFVAVKRFRLNEDERDDMEGLIAKEARVLTMITHQHILPFLGISYMDGAVCIVTPWAENGSLASYLRREPNADRLGLLVQVASALCYLHTNVGDIIIHGDLHVDNVLISDNGCALLSDFGLSRIVPEGNSSSLYRGDSSDFRIGRVVYEAPELHDGERKSWATDVFAFGMLIFHTYAGKQPFGAAQNYLTAVVALYRGNRPARREITRDDFSDELWGLVQRCWHHCPRERPRMPEVSRFIMECLLESRARPSSFSGPESTPTPSQSTYNGDSLDYSAEAPCLSLSTHAVIGAVVVRGVQSIPLPTLYDEPCSSISLLQRVVTNLIAISRLQRAYGDSSGGKTVAYNSHVESLLECGTLGKPQPFDKLCPPYQQFLNGRSPPGLTDCDAISLPQKSPAHGRIKVLFLVLIACTATGGMCALYAEGTNNGYTTGIQERRVSPSTNVTGSVAILAPFPPTSSSPSFTTLAPSYTGSKPASQFLPKWLQQLLKDAATRYRVFRIIPS
ncbi:kinase-like protein [Auricularia subglabra TFB-10046 SS5]|nr:kinase-like protein [Auricularia subglabra TFB-10046 SS5]